MKVVKKTNPTNKITFGELAQGDVFRLEGGIVLWMKFYADYIKAVNIENGSTGLVDDSQIVFPVNGTFVEE